MFGFGGMALLAILLGGLALGVLRVALRSQERLVDDYLADMVVVRHLQSDGNEAARRARDYLLTGDKRQLDALEEVRRSYYGTLADYLARTEARGDRTGAALVESARASFAEAGRSANQAMKLRKGSLDAPLERLIETDVLPARERFDAKMDALVKYAEAQVASAQRAADAASARAWWLLSTGFLVAMVASALLGALVLRALRQRERAEEQRSQAMAQLQRTAEFRERFLGVVGHDLRSPLNAISLSAQGLLASDALREAERRNVRRISAGVTRMSRMITELLDVTRIRLGGGIPVEPRLVDLGGLCREMVEELDVSSARVTLELQGDTHGCWDPGRLGQIVQNLVSNALQYAPPESPVRVRVDGAADGEVVLTVCNGGPPIPADVLPELFEPFRRGRERGEGLGLGLYIAQQIAAAHGGTLDARSSSAEGTLFRARLPRSAEKCALKASA